MRRKPQRSCVACRAVRDKQELIRLVHTLDDRFVWDPQGKVPGRGAYICPTVECLEMAVRRKGFDRAFRQTVPREAVASLAASLQDYLTGNSSGQE